LPTCRSSRRSGLELDAGLGHRFDEDAAGIDPIAASRRQQVAANIAAISRFIGGFSLVAAVTRGRRS